MVRLRSSTSGSVVPCGPKNCSRILLSSPITCQPSDARTRTHSEPIKPPDPVMIAFFDTFMPSFAVYHCGVALWSASRLLTRAVLQVFRNHDHEVMAVEKFRWRQRYENIEVRVSRRRHGGWLRGQGIHGAGGPVGRPDHHFGGHCIALRAPALVQ